MIITKCPLRISLAGGSTDLQDFIDYNGKGAVISFPVNLFTYITLSSDIFGYNKLYRKYVINYSIREETEEIKNIKNDVAREVLNYFNCEQVVCTFNADILSSGSGLASSSSYTISLVKAVSKLHNIKLSDFEICKISHEIEKKFNPLTGYQDIYGCGLGSLKRIEFVKNKDPKINYLSQKLFNDINMYLIFTNVTRQSTQLLNNIDLEKRKKLLDLVDLLENAINENDKQSFFNIINEGWIKKKESSPSVISDLKVKELDDSIGSNKNVLAHRLCGAGNGGFFLAFTKEKVIDKNYVPISISETGVVEKKI